MASCFGNSSDELNLLELTYMLNTFTRLYDCVVSDLLVSVIYLLGVELLDKRFDVHSTIYHWKIILKQFSFQQSIMYLMSQFTHLFYQEK